LRARLKVLKLLSQIGT